MSATPQSKGGSGNVAQSDRVLALVRPDQTIVWVNEAYRRMVGKPFAEIVRGSVAASGIASAERAGWVYERLPPRAAASGTGARCRCRRAADVHAPSRRYDPVVEELV